MAVNANVPINFNRVMLSPQLSNQLQKLEKLLHGIAWKTLSLPQRSPRGFSYLSLLQR